MAYTYPDLIDEVLKQSAGPLSDREITDKALASKLNTKLQVQSKSSPKKFYNSLSGSLYSNIEGHNPRYTKIEKAGEPVRFELNSRYVKNKKAITANKVKKPLKHGADNNLRRGGNWIERDLHSLLAHFISEKKDVKTRTLEHTKTARDKNGLNEWLHPDLVGLHIPLNREDELVELGKLSGNNLIKLYSFELKKSLNTGNYREAFFQAVSNSSWANEGYLVAANIQEDPIFQSELRRLTSSFGIGIIHLRLDDFDSSSVLYPATFKPNVDWETMNKLYKNKDFKDFIRAIKNALKEFTYEFSESFFEDTNFDPKKYIKKHKMK